MTPPELQRAARAIAEVRGRYFIVGPTEDVCNELRCRS